MLHLFLPDIENLQSIVSLTKNIISKMLRLFNFFRDSPIFTAPLFYFQVTSWTFSFKQNPFRSDMYRIILYIA